MEIMQNEASRTPGKRTSDLNHDWAALMCVRQQRAAQVNLQVAECMCDLHGIWICVCLSEESTEKSFKSQKRWVLRQCVPSVPEHSGSFVETLNNCGVLFCETQPHTHTHTSIRADVVWPPRSGHHRETMIAAFHLRLPLISCSLFHALLLVFEPCLHLSSPAITFSNFPLTLSMHPPLPRLHASSCSLSTLVFTDLFAFFPHPPSFIPYISLILCHLLLWFSPFFLVHPVSAPCQPPCLQCDTLLLCVVGLFWVGVLTLSGVGTQSDLWLTRLLTAGHPVHCVCVLYEQWHNVRSAISATMPQFSMLPPPQKKLYAIWGAHYPWCNWTAFDMARVDQVKKSKQSVKIQKQEEMESNQ